MVLHRKHNGAKYLVQSAELRVTVKIHVLLWSQWTRGTDDPGDSKQQFSGEIISANNYSMS